MTSLPAAAPHLAPPGAGLPQPELFIARFLFRLNYWTGNLSSFTATFERERSAIRDLYLRCDSAAAVRRILISRLPGMEDSSRYWSVWMTLDHLRIVNRSIAGTVLDLTNGRIPPGTAGTAQVKPSVDASETVVAAYENSCDHLLEVARRKPNLKTSVRFAHPWFGPLDALGWFALAGSHMGIHRRQIRKIMEAVRQPPS